MRQSIELPDQPFLRPNDRPHWSKRHRLTRDWRGAVELVARAELKPVTVPVDVTLSMVAPDKRRRDSDSLSLALKAAVDGLVDAGICKDDSWLYVGRTSCEILPPDGSKRRSWWLTIVEQEVPRG